MKNRKKASFFVRGLIICQHLFYPYIFLLGILCLFRPLFRILIYEERRRIVIATLSPIIGTVQSIENFGFSGCVRQMVVNADTLGMVHLIISPQTQIYGGQIIRPSDRVIAFYNAEAPMPLIFPPQYRILFMMKLNNFDTVKYDYFDRQLVSRDGALRLNLSRQTNVSLPNGQPFTGNLGERMLLVVYQFATLSIPAQTTPSRIIVMCENEFTT